MMREADLARSGRRASTDEPSGRDRMVWRPKGPLLQGARARREEPRDRVDRRHLKGVAHREGGENSREAPCQHRFAGSWGTGQQERMPSGCSNLKGALGTWVTTHLGEIAPFEPSLTPGIGISIGPEGKGRLPSTRGRVWRKAPATGEVGHYIAEGGRPEKFDPGGARGGLVEVSMGEDEVPCTGAMGGQCEWEGAADRPQLPVQPQFPGEEPALQGVGGEVPGSPEKADRQREVEPAPLLTQLSRGEVDRNALRGQPIPRALQRRADPVLSLPHRALRQPDDMDRWEPGGHGDLDPHKATLDSHQRSRENLRYHVTPLIPRARELRTFAAVA